MSASDSLGRLRLVAFIGPVAFVVAVSALAEFVLELDLSDDAAHFIATVVVCAGALVFTAAMFNMLAQSNVRLQRLARLEERQRFAKALHDEVIQSVYGAQLGLQASIDGAVPSSPTLDRDVNRAIDTLDEVIARVREHIVEEDLA